MKLSQRLALSYVRTKFRLLSSISKKKAAEKAFELFCTPQYRNKKKLPKVFEAAEKLSFLFEGYRIRGYRWNKGGERKVLIIHGFESSVINFDRYVKPLVQKGYEVLAFDAPAHGRSSGKKINALIYRDFLVYINKEYGPVRSFMAHSFGGLAISLALEKIRHREPAKLVLIAPATETKTAIDQFFHFLKLDDGVRTEFDKLILKLRGKPLEWYSVTRALEHISAKVLWFHDEEDKVTLFTDAVKAKSMNFAHVDFVFTKGLGHSRIYRDNSVHKKIIDFL